MSDPQEKVDISDLKTAFLECPVCMEHFNQTDRRPRLLHSCLHAFCRLCLHQLLLKEGKGQITCPLCRQVQKVAETVDSLPVDPVRDQLLDYLAITHKTNFKILCKDCPDENSATSRCVECGENLCQDCENAHRRHRSTRGHKVIPFGELDQEACGTLKIKHFCKNHSDRLIECFCENCEVLCCLLCAVIDHKGHDLKKLDDAAGVKIKEIELLMADVETVHDKLATAKNDCETYAEDIQKEKEKLLSEVDAKFNSAEQLLRERRISVRKEVEESSERLASSAKKNASLYDDTLTEIKSIQTYFSNAKSKTDEVSVLQIYPSLKANVIKLAKTHSGNVTKCSEKITFSTAEEDNVHTYIRGYGIVSTIHTVEESPEPVVECEAIPSCPYCGGALYTPSDQCLQCGRVCPLSCTTCGYASTTPLVDCPHCGAEQAYDRMYRCRYQNEFTGSRCIYASDECFELCPLCQNNNTWECPHCFATVFEDTDTCSQCGCCFD